MYADAQGLPNLHEDVLTAVAHEVEYRTREMIQEAAKFMVHGKRTKLTVDDFNYALESRNVDRIYGYDPSEALVFRQVPNSAIFYVPREEVDLEAFVQQPLPKAPPPMTLTSHWLAVDGVQPQIPENPNLAEATVEAAATVPSTGPKEEAEVRPLVKHVLSKELQAYYDAVVGDLASGDGDKIKAALHSAAHDSGIQQLVPYFVQFVAETIPKNLRNLPSLHICISLLNALLTNEHIFIEPYVQACIY